MCLKAMTPAGCLIIGLEAAPFIALKVYCLFTSLSAGFHYSPLMGEER